MPPHTSPVVRRTTSRLLDQVHRDTVTRSNAQATSGRWRELPRMRPYAEQLAYERGED
ncbi:hypothetical protein [Flexivirga oryzae]|uniref:Uncharacterized protein n=1 Tax=Flexivirga oryzae TaxID=1794944 RepID=A0A839N0J6_9MICO|nr:hypothetical protein [Flexivirga oryzae]MBB2891228.1 hypothetical protein [Flexivirga oryzae]